MRVGDKTASQAEIYHWLGTSPVPRKVSRYWGGAGWKPHGSLLATVIAPKGNTAAGSWYSAVLQPTRYRANGRRGTELGGIGITPFLKSVPRRLSVLTWVQIPHLGLRILTGTSFVVCPFSLFGMNPQIFRVTY